MKKYIITALIIFSVQFTFAQDFFDALRYSQTEYGGTARSISMGSAFGALGSDFVSASINPAGLGMYRSGEFTLSPTLNLNQVESNYLNNKELNNKYNFNFNNLSYVATAKTGAETGIIGITFGVGYNRLKNFNSNQIIQGHNAETTLLNYYTDYANDINDPNKFGEMYEMLAWNTWLVDKDPDAVEGIYYNDLTDYTSYDVLDENDNFIGTGYSASGIKPHSQKSIINKSGRMDEYSIALGLNINHKIFWGATLGLNDLEYNEYVNFSETDDQNKSDFLNNYSLESNIRDSGFGVNLKTGVIFRPLKSLRLGLAFHTPTFFDINRDQYKTMTANYDQAIGKDEQSKDTKHIAESPYYNYNYKFETPLKAVLSAAYSFGDKALLSADYEFVNYSSTKFRASDDNYDYSNQNSDIHNIFNSSSNIRIGGEYRVNTNFSLRAGYNLIGNPWKSTFTTSDGSTIDISNKSDSYNTYSAGFGYRQQNFFVDFAYRLSQINYSQKVHEIYYTNPSKGTALASMKELNNQATITFGFRF